MWPPGPSLVGGQELRVEGCDLGAVGFSGFGSWQGGFEFFHSAEDAVHDLFLSERCQRQTSGYHDELGHGEPFDLSVKL